MTNVQQEVDERSSLARSNKFELLLFRLGSNGTDDAGSLFGINVFKVREIVEMPIVTKVGGAPANVLGVTNMRGQIIQVLDLPAIAGLVPAKGLNIMLVTEFARTIQGFAVESVDDIARLDWNHVVSAPPGTGGSMLTSIAKLPGQQGGPERLVQVLDVESVLRDIKQDEAEPQLDRRVGPKIPVRPGSVVLVAEDSAVARNIVEQTLSALGLPFIMTKTGKEAWWQLAAMDELAQRDGKTIGDLVTVVLTDLEMPEMDGFTLTRNIKSHPRFGRLPVVIHSSLSGTTNEEHVKSVGADAYVAKFSAEDLSRTLRSLLPAPVPA